MRKTKMNLARNPAATTFAAIAFTALAACGPAAETKPFTVPPAAVAVAVDPKSAQAQPGASVTFTATVTGSADLSVEWEVVEAGGGSVDSTGRYTAPAQPGTYHVRARSKVDPAVAGESTVTVTAPPAPVEVAVTPAAPRVDACRTVTLSAAVTGAADGSVTWSVAEGSAGGTVTAAGVYTAPATAGTYHVVATSRADPSSAATATITVSDRILAIAVGPATVSVEAGGTARFTATVTTTCGSATVTQALTSTGALSAN